MKNLTTPLLHIAALIGCMLVLVNARSQNIVVTTATGQQLGDFLNEHLVGNGVVVSNAVFNGVSGTIASPQIGTFYANGFDGISMDSGVVMTTGHISVAQGPNTSNGLSSQVENFYSDSQMQSLATDDIFGCATLDFDFVCEADYVEFYYVFGSEEYPEFVCSSYNDIFAFFISGPNPDGGTMNRNLAIIPGTIDRNNPNGISVSINAVNQGSWSAVSGTGCYSQYSQYYIANPYNSNGVQYDGFTVKLTASAYIIPGETYHMHLSICNIGDNHLDSGVLIEANSFSIPVHELYVNNEGSQSQNQEATVCLIDSVVFSTTTTGNDSTVLWIIDGVEQPDTGMTITYLFDTIGDHSVLALMHGICPYDWCDTLHATIHTVTPFRQSDTIALCDETYTFRGRTYASSGDFVDSIHTTGSCDSVFRLHLTINATHYYTDSIHACDSLQWIDQRWYYRDTAGYAGPLGTNRSYGPVDSLVTVGGCDSIIILKLAVHPSYSVTGVDTFCHNQTYIWQDFTLSGEDPYTTYDYYITDTLRSIWQCDSIVGLHITRMARQKVSVSYTVDCPNKGYYINASSNVPYLVWSSLDTTLDGQEFQPNINVSPSTTHFYYLYTDYHEAPLCPQVDSIVLHPVSAPDAKLNVTPTRLTFKNLTYNAYDMSGPNPERDWYVDSVHQASTASVFTATADADKDSFVVTLRISNGKCWDTASRTIYIDKTTIYAPNAFTPNNGDNNRFTLVTQGVIEGELRIYNRDGLLVFTTRDFTVQGWDGGSSPQGNYVWHLTYRNIEYPNVWQEEVGSVLLIR